MNTGLTTESKKLNSQKFRVRHSNNFFYCSASLCLFWLSVPHRSRSQSALFCALRKFAASALSCLRAGCAARPLRALQLPVALIVSLRFALLILWCSFFLRSASLCCSPLPQPLYVVFYFRFATIEKLHGSWGVRGSVLVFSARKANAKLRSAAPHSSVPLLRESAPQPLRPCYASSSQSDPQLNSLFDAHLLSVGQALAPGGWFLLVDSALAQFSGLRCEKHPHFHSRLYFI